MTEIAHIKRFVSVEGRVFWAHVLPAVPGLGAALTNGPQRPGVAEAWGVYHLPSGHLLLGRTFDSGDEVMAVLAAIALLTDWTQPIEQLQAQDELQGQIQEALRLLQSEK